MIEKWIQMYKMDTNIKDNNNNNNDNSVKRKNSCYLSVLNKAIENKAISKEEMIADITTVLQVTTSIIAGN